MSARELKPTVGGEGRLAKARVPRPRCCSCRMSSAHQSFTPRTDQTAQGNAPAPPWAARRNSSSRARMVSEIRLSRVTVALVALRDARFASARVARSVTAPATASGSPSSRDRASRVQSGFGLRRRQQQNGRLPHPGAGDGESGMRRVPGLRCAGEAAIAGDARRVTRASPVAFAAGGPVLQLYRRDADFR